MAAPKVASNLPVKGATDAVTLATVTAAGAGVGVNSTPTTLQYASNGFCFQLDVTAAATDAGDTLDVRVQTSIDGTNYFDVVAFTQVLGNGGAKRRIAKISASQPQADFDATATLAAGNVRNMFGDLWRVNYTVVDVSTQNAAFTFTVKAMPI